MFDIDSCASEAHMVSNFKLSDMILVHGMFKEPIELDMALEITQLTEEELRSINGITIEEFDEEPDPDFYDMYF